MPARTEHEQLPQSLYFVTFTCCKWLSLIQIANVYDSVYKWFDSLYTKDIRIPAYVIMPNHVHVMLYFPQMKKSLNVIVGNAKRFMAYEIVKRLEAAKDHSLLDTLHGAVNKRERKRGQIHKIFEDSFEAKECYSKEFIYQKLDYIHHNPVSGRWRLIDDFTRYEHSSASFYEGGSARYEKLIHINEVIG